MRLFLNPIKNPNLIPSILHRFNRSDLLKPYLINRSPFLFFSSSSSSGGGYRFSNYYYHHHNQFSSSAIDRNRKFSSESATSTTTMGVVTKTSDEEGTARRFWLKFKKESVFAMYTPFVVCLASGNLDMDVFHHYIAQDVHFLKAFAQAYELAAECADDDDAKAAIFDLRNNVLQELKMHDSFVREWGFDPAKETTANSATLKYTEFLLATASGKVEGEKGLGKIATPFEKTKIAAYTLGAMTPCMRLYAFLGKEIRAIVSPDESSHPFKKWIDNYSSESFEASALQIEELLDKLSICLTGEELEVIEKLYYQAMKLEIEFFSAQPVTQQILVPLSKMIDPVEERLMLFSDFDLTCTVVDSSAILAEIAILTAPKAEHEEQANVLARMLSVDLKNTWSVLSAQYTEEYEQCIENILHHEKVEKYDYEGLSKALEQLSEFENRANRRVIDSGVLKGINMEDIKRAGEHIILQEGCVNFFQTVFENELLDADVHVLSYCWCADLMRSAFSSGGLSDLSIHANEFAYEEAISTGEIIRTVQSPKDKVQAFKDILKKNETDSSKLHVTVYIGDSVGDLLCLLEADIGIVVGSSESLRKVGSQFGVSFVPLFPGVVKKQKDFVESDLITGWEGQSGILYTVSSWAEIHALILGHQ